MSCQHGNWPPCDECDALDEAYERGYKAGKASAAADHAATTNPVRAEQPEGKGAVAWLHTVVGNDGDEDRALSFKPDNFPLEGVCGYRSLSAMPLYAAPAAPVGVEGLRDFLQRCKVPGKEYLYCIKPRELEAAISTSAPSAAVGVDEVRRAVADYMESEGCSCCRDGDAHDRHEKRLAELLEVPPYSDGSGFDFCQFSTSALAGKEGAK